MDFKTFKKVFQQKEVKESANVVSSTPVISVCVQTYQHANYIKQCLDAILIQQVDFPFEILLGEDESIDGTREICIEYAKKYPDKIRLFLHHRKNNIKINGNPTGRFNFTYNLFSARGKYIALCEGDDYWTDPLKLQKQVDFLELNRDYGICFHNVTQLNTFKPEKESIIPDVKKNTIFTLEDYILSNRTATCSILFQKEKLGEIPEWFMKSLFGDLGLILLVMYNYNKKGIVLKDVMGVYRIHKGGIHSKFQKNNETLILAYQQHLRFNKIIKTTFLTDIDFRKILNQKFYNTHRILSKLYIEKNNPFMYLSSIILMKYYKYLK